MDLDSMPEEGVPLREALGFLLSPKTRSLRQVLHYYYLRHTLLLY